MTENEKQINLARIIYDAYPDSDFLPIDPKQDCRNLKTLLARVNTENFGDGLFEFIVNEIIEGGGSSLEGAIKVMKKTAQDIEAVLNALKLQTAAAENNTEQGYYRAAEFLAEQGRKIFTGRPLKEGLWNTRCMDTHLISKEKNCMEAYELLLEFGDHYIQNLSDEQKSLWQKARDTAAAMLQTGKSKGDIKCML